MFITIEGIEGSGKSSLIAALAKWLEEKNLPALVTREPGGTELGKRIRELLLQHTEETVGGLSELLLFSADRAQHVEQVLRPALADGKVVVCDRYIHSTLAYQGFARGVPEATLDNLIALSTGDLLPDLVLLLDLDPEIGLSRARKREAAGQDASSWSRFEAETLGFHRAVRDGFRTLAKKDAARFCLIDANLAKLDVAHLAIEELSRRLTR